MTDQILDLDLRVKIVSKLTVKLIWGRMNSLRVD